MGTNSNEYMREYQKKRYAKRRAEGIKLLGGVCVECGSIEDLQFDHVDKTTKEADVGRLLWNASLDRLMVELVKCQLLCRPHHEEKTGIESSVPHGGGASGKKNCKCEPCRARKAEYMRAYRRPSRR